MSGRQRATLLGLAAAVVAVAVIVAAIGSGDSDGGGTTAATTATTPAGRTTTPAGRTTTATAPAQPPVARAAIEVKGGEAVGGVREISARKGERVSITVSSPDYSGEIHLHGYDLAREVAPGKPARFELTATQEGVFEMEVEATSTEIAGLTVNP